MTIHGQTDYYSPTV